MKLLNLFKRNKVFFSKFKQSNILKESWINLIFKVTLTREKNVSHKEFMKQIDAITADVLQKCVVKAVTFSQNVKRNLTARVFYSDDKKEYSFVLRFINKKKSDFSKNTILIREKSGGDTREYGYSPIDMLKNMGVFPEIERVVIEYFKIEQISKFTKERSSIIKFGYDENKNLTITETDGILFIDYPLIKRIQLFKEYPEFEKKIFKPFHFKKFMKWLMDKKTKDEYMKKYCAQTEVFLKKFNISV